MGKGWRSAWAQVHSRHSSPAMRWRRSSANGRASLRLRARTRDRNPLISELRLMAPVGLLLQILDMVRWHTFECSEAGKFFREIVGHFGTSGLGGGLGCNGTHPGVLKLEILFQGNCAPFWYIGLGWRVRVRWHTFGCSEAGDFISGKLWAILVHRAWAAG